VNQPRLPPPKTTADINITLYQHPSRSPLQRIVLVLLSILGLLALAILAAPQLFYPFGFDQAVYAACGHVIKNGGVPIRDCFETKQMGVMLMYALPMLFTLSPIAIHAFTLLWTAVTSLVIAHIGTQLFDAHAGILAGALYWLVYAGINYWSMDQAETFSNLFLVLAFWLLWRSTGDWGLGISQAGLGRDWGQANLSSPISHLFFAGVCIGITLWFKYVFALIGVVLGACMLLSIAVQRPMFAVRTLIIHSAAYTAGVLLPVALGLGYFALQTGGLQALAQQLSFLRANFPLAEPKPLPEMAQLLLRFLDNGADRTADFKTTVPQLVILGGGFPFIFLLGLIGLLKFIRTRAILIVMLLAYFAVGVVIVAWQGNYIQYHFTIIVPPLVLLAGAAVSPTRRQGEGETRGGFCLSPLPLVSLSFAAAAIATLLLALRMWPWLQDAFDNVITQRKTPMQLYSESHQAPLLPAADYLQQHTQPGDNIAVFGDAPWLYVLADRPNATRFAFINVWIKKAGSANYDLMVQQYLEGLQQNKPVYVVLTKENYPWQNNNYLEDYKAATTIYQYVETNYAYEAEIGPFLMFRRNVSAI
jgi:hypothetical protein